VWLQHSCFLHTCFLHAGFLYDFLTNYLSPLYGRAYVMDVGTAALAKAAMAYLFLMCALCEAFLLRFLVALMTEARGASRERRD